VYLAAVRDGHGVEDGEHTEDSVTGVSNGDSDKYGDSYGDGVCVCESVYLAAVRNGHGVENGEHTEDSVTGVSVCTWLLYAMATVLRTANTQKKGTAKMQAVNT
jgi:hypothetical protein